jgi:hypothetical protein
MCWGKDSIIAFLGVETKKTPSLAVISAFIRRRLEGKVEGTVIGRPIRSRQQINGGALA